MAAITAEEMRELVARALAEDLGDGDVTGEATVPAEATATARIVQKAPGVVFGLDLVVETMAQTGVEEVDTLVAEGEWRQDVPAEVLVARGSARALLAAERTALNFLGHLSGVATLTARYVEAVAGTEREDPRHPQDDARAAQAGEGGGRGGRRHQPPDGPLRRLPDQGEPHRRRRGHRRRRSTRRARRIPSCRSRSRSRTSTTPPTRSAPAPTSSCSTTWTRRRCAPRSSSATPTAPAASRPSRPPATSTWRPSARSPRPASTSSRVGALTHSAPVLDFSLLLRAD